MKKNHILEMKAHSKTHFENENMFSEKRKAINLFKKKLSIQPLLWLTVLHLLDHVFMQLYNPVVFKKNNFIVTYFVMENP